MGSFQIIFSKAVEVLTLTNNIQHDAWRKICPSIVNSMLKPDCLKNGKDIGQQGSRYNTTFNVEICGGVNLVNSLASLKKNVYEDKTFSIDGYREAILSNFGYMSAKDSGSYSIFEQMKNSEYSKWVKIHRKCLDAPKYGNDNPFVDNIFRDWQEWFCEMAHNYRSLYDKPMYACQISVSTHGPMGAVTLASPDGRLQALHSLMALSRIMRALTLNGPYALFNSATCWNHSLSQNSQLNLKIHPICRKRQRGFQEVPRTY